MKRKVSAVSANVPATIHSGSTVMSAISSVSTNRVHMLLCPDAFSSATATGPGWPLSRWSPRIETNSAIRAGRRLRFRLPVLALPGRGEGIEGARLVRLIGEPNRVNPHVRCNRGLRHLLQRMRAAGVGSVGEQDDRTGADVGLREHLLGLCNGVKY